jgi:hypothetical protein
MPKTRQKKGAKGAKLRVFSPITMQFYKSSATGRRTDI